MKKNLLKKASVYFINFLVVLMIVVLPVATVQAASQIETPIETRSKQNSNLEGGGDLSYINLFAYTNRFGTAASGRSGSDRRDARPRPAPRRAKCWDIRGRGTAPVRRYWPARSACPSPSF